MAQRHPLHSICPYFAMFPEEFAERNILAYSSVGDVVYDPFSGRGTTVFQSLLMGRKAAGTDINPVAACISGAKADAPSLLQVLRRITELEGQIPENRPPSPTPFFDHCFHEKTLGQILYLREALDWRANRIDRFIAAMMLGALHGESHRSKLCLSNRMPRTISTKPEYSIRWWTERGLEPPERNAFEVLRELAKFRLKIGKPDLTGKVVLADARDGADVHKGLRRSVKLIVTSPPYLDVTDYGEDQWLRLWFLGGGSAPQAKLYADDRHTGQDLYWRFLAEVWAGIAPLAAENATIVIRIGGALERDVITENLTKSLEVGFKKYTVSLLGDVQTTSLRKRQTNAFRPGTKAGVEHDYTFALSKTISSKSSSRAIAVETA
uniref:DNA methyltransferase n=1 Tax=uncultured Caulobacter sp. TaxID=158749 RepID=UPI0025D8FE19|nr:DNA methyltransferase [uncultured Caulobacter sp.]